MFLNQSVQEIKRAVEEYKIAIPKTVIEAEALHDAAVELLSATRSEIAPVIDNVNIKNLKVIHAESVAWPLHDDRVAVAVKIESSTEAKRLWAWQAVSPIWMEAFREPFNDAAGLFVKSLNELGGAVNAELAIKSYQVDAHRFLVSAAAELETLARLRKLLAVAMPFDSGRDDVSALGRVLTLPNMAAVMKIKGSIHREFSIEWFAQTLTIEGVEIKWHAPKDQQTLHTLGQG